MAENKSSVSKADSYREIGEYWDAHDASEIWDETEEVNFEINLKSDVFYYAVETSLSRNFIESPNGAACRRKLWLIFGCRKR